ncbi:Asp-tRNA(Asn)/Glu-tRNA(Gln) amidotransferase subunit GatB [Zongyangia hominis]|uniref:Aspartyl/glutamyl-tRNA(Asn/Gln) amidotransferase subunit B n=1 Tax=Zongyangia hominis TaxID=2763677 RepID=A0A926EEW2_9FIRM|nr:Asp-tRNA(Asn)/Glu-tRNA(Gln) amidotransferase subunit GatB [Zongyangia hominis]MBC8571189.1 Asp-tRNA(Asn)/Glu-tRNA(Gln) amidotransferase subunit GatB [Zongyangia hominis]
MSGSYEMVVGLEVHVELSTKTKIFCGCSTAFGAAPNTQCCPVCMGMPGALPVLNERVVEYAVKAGLATHCAIARFSKQDRKNYFYPDLPKAYQISQYDLPLCEHGWLDVQVKAGEKRIGITRIHIEEDAGKLIHTEDGGTLCDYNRCGVPLIEIVTEPDIRSAEEAVAFVRKLRSILRYAGISDCKMQEGSLRCDVNLSVRKRGEQTMGTRTEMKNLNSFQFIAKAITYEFKRQVEAVESGEAIVQETRRFDEKSGKTFSMRKKEDADDYRYFPDPDLAPIVLSDTLLTRLEREIPVLPDERKALYRERYGLTDADGEALVSEREIADYFEAAAAFTRAPGILANLITSEVFRLLAPGETCIPVAPAHLGQIADMLEEGKINSGTGKKLIGALWREDQDPAALAEREGLWQLSDESLLRPIARQVIGDNEKSAADYRRGKTQAIQTLIGQCMRQTKGKGNPVLLRKLLEELLRQE